MKIIPAGQRMHELWIEKNAFIGVIEGICTALRVPYFANIGNNSQMLQYQAGKRFKRYFDQGLIPRRIALNMGQVRQYNPPPNFVKEGDARTRGYRESSGTDECWELDSLSPTVIADLIRDELEQLIDPRDWRQAIAKVLLRGCKGRRP